MENILSGGLNWTASFLFVPQMSKKLQTILVSNWCELFCQYVNHLKNIPYHSNFFLQKPVSYFYFVNDHYKGDGRSCKVASAALPTWLISKWSKEVY